jgi:RNA polymerase sigma factor (sigma-70 family)
MRGKQPKEREHYVLRMADGTLVDVTREVYLEWYQSRRKEKYQNERNQKHGICSLNELEDKENFSGIFLNVTEGLEETVLRNICRDKVRAVLENLPAEDARLIELLYFREITVTDAAQTFRCSRKTIQNRRKRILKDLFQKMQEQGIQGGYF